MARVRQTKIKFLNQPRAVVMEVQASCASGVSWRKGMTLVFCDAPYVWLSTLLQSLATLHSLLARWQAGDNTLWWYSEKAGNGRGYTWCLCCFLPVVPLMASLLLLWLQPSHWVLSGRSPQFFLWCFTLCSVLTPAIYVVGKSGGDTFIYTFRTLRETLRKEWG